jgi:hypothetical protein
MNVLQGEGRPERLLPASPLWPAAAARGNSPVPFIASSPWSDMGSTLRASSPASTSRAAVNKGCFYITDWTIYGPPQHSTDSHLAREESDLMLKKFGS